MFNAEMFSFDYLMLLASTIKIAALTIKIE